MTTFFKLACGLLLIILLAVNRNYAQSAIGIRAGVMSSKQDIQDSNIFVDAGSKFGADIAFIADFPIGILSISPEFHWLQKGGKIEDLNGSVGEVSRTFNYLEIPLLIKLHFGKGINFFILGGPSVGYLLNGTDKDMDGQTNDIDLDFYKRAEFGMHAGGGIGIGPIKIDVRYMAGLSDVANSDGNLGEIKNSAVGAGLTFKF